MIFDVLSHLSYFLYSGDYLQMILEVVEVFFTIPLPSILLLL